MYIQNQFTFKMKALVSICFLGVLCHGEQCSNNATTRLLIDFDCVGGFAHSWPQA